MKMKYLAFVIILRCSAVHMQETYTAAVVSLMPERKPLDLPRQIPNTNADLFVTNIQEAKKHDAKIIVFPENGLTTLEPEKMLLEHLGSYSLTFELNDIPCEKNNTYAEALIKLSCAARVNDMYVVVNVLEPNGSDIFYNTNIVFDNSGKIIKRYRKKNLQNEKFYKAGEQYEQFNMKIGSKDISFGLLIGSDILHKSASELAKSVSNIIYTTSLPSELPYFNGLSFQMGYAVGNNVNLLASSYYSLEDGISGSGIYPHDGKNIEVVSFSKSSVIVADLPLSGKTNQIEDKCNKTLIKDPIGQESQYRSFKYKVANMSSFSTESIHGDSVKNKRLCSKSGDICCDFTIELEQSPNGKYEFSYYEGPLESLGIKNGKDNVFICQITSCLKNGTCIMDLDQVKIRSLQINVTHRKDNVLVPLTLKSDFMPFKELAVCMDKPNQISLKATDMTSVVNFGYYILSSSAGNVKISIMFLLSSFFLLRLMK